LRCLETEVFHGCGAGGGVRADFPDLALFSSVERIKEATDTGASALVSACPWCEENLLDGVKNLGAKLEVYDVVELVARAL
jgi:Fe-S oxidoreductase